MNPNPTEEIRAAVVTSLKRMGWYNDDVLEDICTRTSTALEKLQGMSRQKDIHEELRNQPKSVIDAVCDILEIPMNASYDNKSVASYINNQNKEKRQKIEVDDTIAHAPLSRHWMMNMMNSSRKTAINRYLKPLTFSQWHDLMTILRLPSELKRMSELVDMVRACKEQYLTEQNNTEEDDSIVHFDD